MNIEPFRVLCASLVLACAAARAEPAQSPPASSAAPDSDPVVCRTYPPPLGSRIGDRKICHKLSEWNRMQQDTQDRLRQVEKAGDLTRAPPD